VTLRAVFFDLGGVIVRTEFQAPRQHLAERLGLEYEDIVKAIFEGESSRQASIGAISEDKHWAAVMRKLHLPASETQAVRDEFFAGDITDRALLDFMRGLRKTVKVGLISNAWSGLRPWIVSQKFDDAFDAMTISAEAGVMKPDARIYLLALESLGVRPEEAVFLDDFIENVKGAQEVGMAAIHFVQPEQALEKLKRNLNTHR
jgi:epoxide hydrolase-like predicted phosphatase